MAKPQKQKIKLGKLCFNLCKALNDSFCGRSSYPFNTFSIYFLIAAAIALPITMGQAYFQSWWHIAIEIIFFLFFIGFLSCVILFYKKSVWHWCVAAILLVHYGSLADVIINNSSEFGVLYLGFVGVYFISYASWKSAKDVNRKGGLLDTVILAIGIACCAVGLILLQEQAHYGKNFIIVGVAFVYIYAIARALFWLIYTQEKIKLNLIKTMVYVAFYIALVVGLPFFLHWAGVEENTLQNIIIPIYASILGGALALAGVAWTIRFTKNERMEQDKKRDEERREEERLRLKPLFAVKDAKGAYEGVISVEFCCRDTVFSDYHGYIENSDQSNFIFHSILDDDGNEQELNYSKTILKDRLVFLRIKGLEKTGKVFAVFSDILNNKYYYIMLFSAGRNRSDPMFLKEIAEISREEYIKEKNKRKKSEQ